MSRLIYFPDDTEIHEVSFDPSQIDPHADDDLFDPEPEPGLNYDDVIAAALRPSGEERNNGGVG